MASRFDQFSQSMKYAWRGTKSVASGVYAAGRSGAGYFFRGHYHEAGMEWTRSMFGIGKRTAAEKIAGKLSLGTRGLMGAFGGYMLLSDVAEGYREGGVSGAVTSGAINIGSQYAIGRAGSFLLKGALPFAGKAAAVGAGVAVIGAGLKNMSVANFLSPLARPWVREHAIKHATLEMGAPTVDPFGMVSTMRQRSLMAIQNSRVNGRTALGNEAMLLYRPYNL